MSSRLHFSTSFLNRFDDWKYFRRPLVSNTHMERVETEGGESEMIESGYTEEEISREDQHLAGARFALTTGDSFSRTDWGLFRGTIIDVQISGDSSSLLVNDSIRTLADMEFFIYTKSNAFVDFGIAWKKETPWMTDKLPWTLGIAGFFGDNPMESPEEEASFTLLQGKIIYHHTFTNRLGSIGCAGKSDCEAEFEYPDTLDKESNTDDLPPDPGEPPVVEGFKEFQLGMTSNIYSRIFGSKTGIFKDTSALPLHATFSLGISFYTPIDRFQSTAFLELETPLSRFVTFFVNSRIYYMEKEGWKIEQAPFGPLPQEARFFSVESGIRVFTTPTGI